MMTLYDMPIHRAVATASGFGMVIAVPSVIGFLFLHVPSPALHRRGDQYPGLPAGHRHHASRHASGRAPCPCDEPQAPETCLRGVSDAGRAEHAAQGRRMVVTIAGLAPDRTTTPPLPPGPKPPTALALQHPRHQHRTGAAAAPGLSASMPCRSDARRRDPGTAFPVGALPLNPEPLHPGQLSVIRPGYPQPSPTETATAFAYPPDRDAAHLDGLDPAPDGARMMQEPHHWILGLPLNLNTTPRPSSSGRAATRSCDGSAHRP